MTILDLSGRDTWKRLVDRETFAIDRQTAWIVALSAPVIGSWIFALVLIDNAFP
jgi:hypothetical protein